MAVTTTQTNKPINPRGNDQSPKGYNRAALYSGKALSFDGVNDYITTSLALTSDEVSVSFYLNWDDVGTQTIGFICEGSANDKMMIHTGASGAGVNGLQIAINVTNYSVPQIISEGWNHYLITSDRTNLNIYKNGVLFDSRTTDAGAVDITALTLGVRPIGTAYALDGKLSNFKLFSTALTAAQVADLYNNPEKVVPTGVDNTALKLWLPMMEGAGTMCVNGAPDAIGSELVTNGDFATDSDWTKEGSWTISGGVASISSSTNDRIYQSVSLDANKKYLLSINVISISTASIRFRFGGNGSASNLPEITTPGIYNFISAPISGTSSVGIFAVSGASATIDNLSVKEISNNGTISGATWTHGIGAPVSQTSVIDWNKHTLDGTNEVLIPQGLTSGRDLLGNLFENVRKQGALNLDGNSWAEVHDNESLDIGSGSWTFETWIDFDDSNQKGILSRWYGSSRGALLYKRTDRISLYTGISSGAADYELINSGSISSGWKHIVGTYDSNDTKLRIYIDGSLNATSAAFANAYNSNTNPLEIGRHNDSALNSYPNQIAQPRIYNRALTAEEVERNYNAGKNIYK